jgi:hypothetical protein
MADLSLGKEFGHTSDGTGLRRWGGAMRMVSAWSIMMCLVTESGCEPEAERS